MRLHDLGRQYCSITEGGFLGPGDARDQAQGRDHDAVFGHKQSRALSAHPVEG